MPRAAAAITRFNAGLLSRLIGARVDEYIRPYYEAGAQVLSNFIPFVEGPITKRPGFELVKPILETSTSRVLIPFEVNSSAAFILEMWSVPSVDQVKFRTYQNGAALLNDVTRTISGAPSTTNPVEVTTTATHGYSTGAEVYIVGSGMTEINGRFFKVTNTGSTTFTLDNEDGTSRTTSGTGGSVNRVNEYTLTLFPGEVTDIDWAQRGGSLFMVHPERVPFILGMTIPSSGSPFPTFSDLITGWIPFEYDSTSGIGIQASGATGAGITLTASSALFVAGHVGRFLRLTDTTSGIGPLADSGGEGYVEITAVGSSTSATANVIEELDPQVVSSPTTRWAWDAWNDTNGYPSCIAVFDERVYASGVSGLPGEIWTSRIGGYGDFSRLATDEGGMHFEIQGGENYAIQWIEPLDEVLIAGTARGEFTIEPVDFASAIAAGNVKARRRSATGSQDGIKPVVVDSSIIFAQRAGRRLREFRYELANNIITSADLNRLSIDITAGVLGGIAYQQEPNRIIWSYLDDGSLVAVALNQDERVVAWANSPLGGDADVLSVASIPSTTSTTDQVWILTERTINSQTVQFIEIGQPFWERPSLPEDSKFLDCSISYDGAATTSFAGANHLEGETVKVLADGVTVPDVTISDGKFTIERAASKVVVGFGYSAQYISMPIEAGSADGTSQGKRGSTMRLMIRLDQTGEAIEYGPSLEDLRSVPLRTPQDPMDAPAPLFDGDQADLIMPMNQRTRQEIAIQHSAPLPCTVVGIFPRLEAR